MAVESSFRGGMKLEVLRSLCQVANDTQLRLEVALVDAQRRPSARSLSSQTSGPRRSDSLVRSGIRRCLQVFWQLLWACSASLCPSSLFAHPCLTSAGLSSCLCCTRHCLWHMRCSVAHCCAEVSAATQKQEGAIEEEIFENERYLPIRGWGSRGGLLPTERRRYSTRDGSQSFNDFPTLHLPTGEMLQRSASVPCMRVTLVQDFSITKYSLQSCYLAGKGASAAAVVSLWACPVLHAGKHSQNAVAR